MQDLRDESKQLRALAERSPTPELRAEVRAALRHKREGIQSVAAQVLGTWGGQDSIDALRVWLVDCYQREAGWSVRGVAVRELARLVRGEDASWVLDLYFSVPGWLLKHELLPLVLALPPESARERLVQGLRDASWENRQAAAKAIGNLPIRNRQQLLRPLAYDEHPEVRSTAQHLSQRG